MLKEFLHYAAAPIQFRGPVFLNKMGLQSWRTSLKHLMWKLSPEYASGIPPAHRRTLEENGILILPNYYPQDVFKKIEEECRLAEAAGLIKTDRNKNNTNVDWHHGNVPSHDSRFTTLQTMFQKNRSILQMVSFVSRRPVLHDPKVIYQHLSLPKGKRDDVDVEQVLHADRYYQTVKVIFYLEDVGPEDGPFIFCPGTHRMDRRRLELEKDFGIREALMRTGQAAKIPSSLLERGRNAIPDEIKKSIDIVPVVGKKNTLVVANTCGFHARGMLHPGRSRKCLRMIFHYVHAPYVMQYLLSLFRKDPALHLN